jgi:hypothetical protein
MASAPYHAPLASFYLSILFIRLLSAAIVLAIFFSHRHVFHCALYDLWVSQQLIHLILPTVSGRELKKDGVLSVRIVGRQFRSVVRSQ